MSSRAQLTRRSRFSSDGNRRNRRETQRSGTKCSASLYPDGRKSPRKISARRVLPKFETSKPITRTSKSQDRQMLVQKSSTISAKSEATERERERLPAKTLDPPETRVGCARLERGAAPRSAFRGFQRWDDRLSRSAAWGDRSGTFPLPSCRFYVCCRFGRHFELLFFGLFSFRSLTCERDE